VGFSDCWDKRLGKNPPGNEVTVRLGRGLGLASGGGQTGLRVKGEAEFSRSWPMAVKKDSKVLK